MELNDDSALVEVSQVAKQPSQLMLTKIYDAIWVN